MTQAISPSRPTGARAASAGARATDRILPGIILMLAFCTLAPLLDVSSKLAAEAGVPVGWITAARFIVQGLMMAPIILAMGISPALNLRALGLVFLRAFLLVFSTFSFVSGLTVMPIADALAVAFLEPFILLLLGSWIFGDEVGPRRIAACIVGFAGSLLIIQPSITVFGLMALWPLGTAFGFALYMLVTRGMSSFMHPVAMQFHTSWAGVVLCLPVLAVLWNGPLPQFAFVMPEGITWLWLVGVGFWACISHMCMTMALSYAPSATLGPLHYFEIVIAVILGYLVFNDLPNGLSFAGIAIIIASGLYLVHRERVAIRERARQTAAAGQSARIT
ncbi:DMT family transporter [Rhodobacter sp. 24-YEA-8]|uniref:DMT family transporter n=1 Tax=Rhodobacter sp. 24-YEA-8 TaxID=1884310 RepID=UPI000897ADD3|nr:DMT family transporter [Rhodobacter sp. 24-YEA-8]SEB54555.1 EamA domain-containing membrane protein RarD [Rhodobacter sp. 24-YEA-8]